MTTPTYSVHWQTTTPESVEHGDCADTGTDTDREPLAPDQWDVEEATEEGMDPVAWLAVEVLKKHWATEPSDSRAAGPCWFSQCDPAHGRAYFEKGEETTHTVHFHGLTDEQWEQVHARRPK